jgi:hypothetical protein
VPRGGVRWGARSDRQAAGARATSRQGRAWVADGWPLRYSAGRRGREPASNTWALQHCTGGG